MDHLSSSQITLYLQCGLKYKYQYIDMLPKPFRPSALAFGSVLHSALQWLHEERMKGKNVSLDLLYRIFDADWYTQKLSAKIRFKDGEQEIALIHLGKEFLGMYIKEKLNPTKGCEIPFTVPLFNPETGEDLGITLHGYLDRVEEDDTIVEYKTSAQTLGVDDLDSRIQFTAYSYAYSILHHKEPKSIKVVNFVKGKKPKLVISETKRTKADYKGFLLVATQVFLGIKSNLFMPRTGFWCKECEYANVCPMWNRQAITPATKQIQREAA